MGLFVPFQPPPAEYANHLAVPQPQRLRLPSAHWLLLFLVLLCLIPRVLMALRIPSVCPDGVLYIHLAQAIDAGDWRSGFRDTTFNVYPLILTGLHRLGFDWEFAAKLWGVTVSSLVVLPLWGWVRRQFDDRIALVACLLYAVNPKFIEWSPEVMRDPTFWLLFMTAIYWLWRAVTEVRYSWFLADGAAIMLASLTRMEGLFLLIPLTLWTFWRFVALGGGAGGSVPLLHRSSAEPGPPPSTACEQAVAHRTNKSRLSNDCKRLLLGAVLCVLVFPALAVAVKVGWAYGHSDWSVLRLSPLARVETWLQWVVGHAPANVDAEGLEKPLGFSRMIWIFIPTMTRGLSPVFALLMFGGIWGWRRVWGRRDHQPLFYTAVVIMCGIWIQLWYDRNICPRYALPIVLMASPWAALGLLGLISRLLRIAGWMRWGTRPQQTVVASVAVIVALISLGDAMTSNGKYFETRQMAADLGCWVRNKYPQSPAIVGPVGITPIISFYARNAPYRPFRWEADDDSILLMIQQSQAGVVLLQPAKELTAVRCAALAARLKEAGLEPVDRSALPATCDGLSVLLRGRQDSHVVREPSRVY
jgi:4-amino-4-deoxy-L-arabinose transferase-like glycosyltransferase